MEKLLINLPEFIETQRDAIRDAAKKQGYAALFCDQTEDALREASDASVILSGNPALVPAAKALRWFCAPSAGVDHFVRVWDQAPEDAILTNSSGAYGVTISEHIVMVLLELMRKRAQYREIVSRREWVRNLPVRSILGSRITFLGTGDIGQETVKKIRGFRPAGILGVNRSGKNPADLFDRVVPVTELPDVLRETDVLIMSLPGTKESTGILSREMLAILPDQAIVVNVGRGNSIDEEALLSELHAGRLLAALDVFQTEPLPQDSPFYDCPNLLLTPHVSGNMTLPYTVQQICDLFLADFERFVKGERPERLVDVARGY